MTAGPVNGKMVAKHGSMFQSGPVDAQSESTSRNESRMYNMSGEKKFRSPVFTKLETMITTLE